MRKLLILSFAALLFSFADLQTDVQKRVTTYVRENTDDPTGYQIVKFGAVQKFMTSYYMTDEARLYIELAKIRKELAVLAKDKGDIDAASKHITDVKNLLDTIAMNAAKYKPYQYGWKIYHKYRMKDYYGQLRMNEDTFFLDKKLKIIDRDTITIIL